MKKDNITDDFDVDFDVDFDTELEEESDNSKEETLDKLSETFENVEEAEEEEIVLDDKQPEEEEITLDNKEVEHEKKVETKEKVKENDEETKDTVKKEENLILYIVTDRKVPGMLKYFRDCDINVSSIFTSIKDAKDTLLMQVEPSRIIIMDTGTGRFTNIASRKSLVDMIGICDDDTHISVFFTDSIIKSEVHNSTEIDAKQIEWYKYRSTIDVVAHITQFKIQNKENYVLDIDTSNSDETKIEKELLLKHKGIAVRCTESIKLGEPVFTLDALLINMQNESESDMEKFDVRY